MKLNTRGQYAIVALTYMKKENEGKDVISPIRLCDISESEKISQHYLEQIFRKLRIAGVVKSSRGPGGGYFLVKKDAKYSEILEAVEEEVSLHANISPRSEASRDAVANLTTLHMTTVKAFESTTI